MNKLTAHEIIEKLAECACEGRLIIFVGATWECGSCRKIWKIYLKKQGTVL